MNIPHARLMREVAEAGQHTEQDENYKAHLNWVISIIQENAQRGRFTVQFSDTLKFKIQYPTKIFDLITNNLRDSGYTVNYLYRFADTVIEWIISW